MNFMRKALDKVLNMWNYSAKEKSNSKCKNILRNYCNNSTEKEFMKPKSAIGESLFKQFMLNSTVFVDKSLLIKEFLEN